MVLALIFYHLATMNLRLKSKLSLDKVFKKADWEWADKLL